MERILNNRLRWWLESNRLIHQCQSGFRAKQSTKDCILRLHDDVYKAIPNKRSTLAVFLDLEKAYDRVWRDGLLYKFGSLGITGKMFRWIRSFLKNRTFQVRVGSTLSDRYVLDNGIPQGSVLSPLLFSIMMNDLPDNLAANINIFADDCCIWETGLDLTKITSVIQESLRRVTDWCDEWGFRISASKSAVVLFTRRRKIPQIQLTVAGNILNVKKEYKYLGITLNSRLTYRAHSNNVLGKCHKRMNLLRLLCGTSWGGSKISLLTIYRTMIRPVIEYGFEAYLFSSQYVLDTMQKIQNTALRICCGAMPSTPKIALQHSCNELPVRLRHLYACLQYRNHLLSTEHHPCAPLVTPSWHEIWPQSGLFKTFNMLTTIDLFNFERQKY